MALTTVRRGAALAVAALLASCGRDAPPPPEVAANNGAESAAAPAVATRVNEFDPATLRVGDPFLGLTVESEQVERVRDDSVWVGDVVFTGDLVVQGVYQVHPDWPNVTEPCFHVTDPGSIARVPRFPLDDPAFADLKTWFCFSPADVALEVLGPPDQPRELVVAVDHYHVQRNFTDSYDTAELMEVLDQGPPAARTLIER